MSIDLESLRQLRLTRRQTVTPRDVILYALGIGMGFDPTDERALRFLHEDRLTAVPSMAITLAYPELLAAFERAGAVPGRVLHGEQRFVLHRALPVNMCVEGDTRVLQVVDKGPGKGLLVHYATEVRDAADGTPLATLNGSSFLLDEGGAGGFGQALPAPIERHAIPATPPDIVCDLPSLAQAALIYRLSGDLNPLHALPSVAHAAGYARPILHGRCTFGMAAHAVLRSCCNFEAHRLTGMSARFTAIVYPGETVRTELWRAAGGAYFRCSVVDRGRVVLDNGFASIAA